MSSHRDVALGAGLGLVLGFTAARLFYVQRAQETEHSDPKYSDPNQPRRFAAQKKANCTRALCIEKHFKGSLLKGKRILITGANRGIGLALVKEAVDCGAKVIAVCRKTSTELKALPVEQTIKGIDVQSNTAMKTLVYALNGKEVDIVINNAGYFKTERESIVDNTMDFSDEVKTIDICAVGILRVTNALFHGNLLKKGSKVAMITSQGGSISWRDTQCPQGGDYGHHMSKAAANMAGKLCANELKAHGIAVGVLHPGFNRTDMTKKYAHIWEVEGAVDANVGAKRVLHEINRLSMKTTGKLINCEDGLEIPW